jgi:hypothetical protein
MMNGNGTSLTFIESEYSAAINSLQLSIVRDSIDVTSMSASEALALTPNSMYEINSASMQMLFDPLTITDIPLAGDLEWIQIVLSDDCRWMFRGFIDSFEITGQNNELITASVNIKGSGEIRMYYRLPIYTQGDRLPVFTQSDRLRVYGG